MLIAYCRTAYRNPGFITKDAPPPNFIDNNAEITISKPQTRIKHLSTENDENDEKFEKSEKNSKNHTKQPQSSISTPDKIEEPAFIETRFCTVCYIEQPLRAKHCRECGKCVALHDHHCPWLGICIGERNRFYFWWYLLFECTLLWTSAVTLVLSFEPRIGLAWLLTNGIRLALVVVVAFFILMTSCLLGYHSYLALVNQTTWENVSWEKISYLKQRHKRNGSPFSRGICFNLWFYCWRKVPKSYTVWYIARLEAESVV